jgi:tetratricopeptide (TPR) repeat protein
MIFESVPRFHWPSLRVVILLITSIGFTSCKRQENEQALVIRDAQGRVQAPADLKNASGEYKFEIAGGTEPSAEAKRLHEMGRLAGQKGDYPKALELLAQASALAPAWPHPLYDRAYTHLLMKDYDGAREYYRKTLALSPRGFFTAITELDALEQESKGELPAGTYLEYLSVAWTNDPAKKLERLRGLTSRVPQFAPAWKTLSDFIDDDGEKLAVIERGLGANPDAETKGVLQINKALILDRRGEQATAIRMLEAIARDPKSTSASEKLAKFALENITKK